MQVVTYGANPLPELAITRRPGETIVIELPLRRADHGRYCPHQRRAGASGDRCARASSRRAVGVAGGIGRPRRSGAVWLQCNGFRPPKTPPPAPRCRRPASPSARPVAPARCTGGSRENLSRRRRSSRTAFQQPKIGRVHRTTGSGAPKNLPEDGLRFLIPLLPRA